MANCALCLKEKQLCQSHIIPKFVSNWIKDTSFTGYLRQPMNIGKRLQDGFKKELLCSECENIFSGFEREFANKIFYPYVKEELDSTGDAQGKVNEFIYEEWLTKFLISLSWRILIVNKEVKGVNSRVEGYSQKFKKKADDFGEQWRLYLLGESNYFGKCDIHLMFFQNMIYGEGSLPNNIHPRVNEYLLRSFDTTTIYKHNGFGTYSKLAPIISFISLIPDVITDSQDSRVYKKGRIKVHQRLGNVILNDFVLVKRPSEFMHLMEQMPKSQVDKLEMQVLENLDDYNNTLTSVAHYSDFILQEKLKDNSDFKF